MSMILYMGVHKCVLAWKPWMRQAQYLINSGKGGLVYDHCIDQKNQVQLCTYVSENEAI